MICFQYFFSYNHLKRYHYNNEHGTHVVAIAAGKCICSYDDTTGTRYSNSNLIVVKTLNAENVNSLSEERVAYLLNEFCSYISLNSWCVSDFNDKLNVQHGELDYRIPNNSSFW